jgi:heme oxygenase
MKALKEGTREAHEHIERHPLAVALATGKLTAVQYRNLLVGYWQLHQVLGRLCTQDLECMLPSVEQRSVWLAGDLRSLRQTSGASFRATRALQRFLSAPAAERWGVLYVFEGSALGNVFLSGQLIASLDLRSEESQYFRGYGPATMSHFRDFGARVNGAVAEPDVAACVAAADETFRLVECMFGEVDLMSRETMRPAASSVFPRGALSAFA